MASQANMTSPSFGGRRAYDNPRADGPAISPQVGFRQNHSTNGSGSRIPGGEPSLRYNSRNYTTENQQKIYHNGGRQGYQGNANRNNGSPNYQRGRNFKNSNGNRAPGLTRFPQSRDADEDYRRGNNYHRRATPSGPRNQIQNQGYNRNHRPGQNYGSNEHRSNQYGPRQGDQAPGHQNNRQFDYYQSRNRRRRGGRNRHNHQNEPLPVPLPLPLSHPEISDNSIDDLELCDEPVEPFVPILGPDSLYYDRDGDVIIEDAPVIEYAPVMEDARVIEYAPEIDLDIARIVSEGAVDIAKISQKMLESITALR